MTRELAALALKIVHIAWMSTLLGIALEAVALTVLIASGGNPKVFGVIASLLARVSWSVVVCAALAVATAVPRGAVPAAGLTGFLVAPPTAVVAKVLQKVVGEALAGAAAPLALPLVFTLAAWKGVEYAWLGAMLAWLGRRQSGFLAAVGVGMATGLVFGSVATGLSIAFTGFDAVAAVSTFANELLFPIGCSVALYGAEQLARLFVPPLTPPD